MKKRIMILAVSSWLLLGISTVSSLAQNNNDQGTQAMVYTMSNDPSGNAVLAFELINDSLSPAGVFPTGGLGSGGREPDFGLGNAHALRLSSDGSLLFVANPGSNDISVFAVQPTGLTLVDREPSGGQQPLSLTVFGNLLYVLNGGGNVGGSDNITGFQVGTGGKLTQLSNSTRPLSTAVTAPAQIQFSPDGKVLVVTEKATNNIDTYTVDASGIATGPIVTAADAQTPFGFDTANLNQLFVSDDFNDAAGEGALSSWLVSDDGTIHLVSSKVPSGESGACWVVVHQSGAFAFVANTVSSTVSMYAVNSANATVSFLSAFPSPFSETDLGFSADGKFLFALAPDQNFQGSPGINVWRFQPANGNVMRLPGVTGLPRSVDGLATR